MNTLPPALRLEVIRRSQRCLTSGLLSLIPVLGLPMAVAAINNSTRIKRRCAGGWNPGDRTRSNGVKFAWLGLAINLLSDIVVVMIISNQI